VAAPGNTPGARFAANTWTDASGRLWLFGGRGYDSVGTNQLLNDLWQYSASAGQWTWVGGASLAGAFGNYGTLGNAAASNVPGARTGASSWIDASGKVWLFGGFGVDSVGGKDYLNDLWDFAQ
jgi:N-acetylneuraminic acid mutarotase